MERKTITQLAKVANVSHDTSPNYQHRTHTQTAQPAKELLSVAFFFVSVFTE